MWRGGLLTDQGIWQNESDVVIPKIRNKARITSLMTSIIAFYKCILRIIEKKITKHCFFFSPPIFYLNKKDSKSSIHILSIENLSIFFNS